jgi:membrane-associated phospholipid phosphatase
MKLLANIVAYTLHPVTLTIPAVFLIVFISTHNANLAFYWTFVSLVFTGVISTFVLFGVKKGFFNNIDVSNRKQRIILYPVVIIVVLLFGFIVYSLNGPRSLVYASCMFVAALILFDVVNTKIKASIHVASVASLVTGVVYHYGGISYLLIFLIPLMAWARIKEKRHTLRETIVGGIMGTVFSFIAIYIVQFIR